MGLIKVLVIGILVYWLIKILFRLMIPFFASTSQQQHQKTKYGYNNGQQEKEGDVTIRKKSNGNADHSGSGSVGEYIDYEEVKD